MAQKKAGGSSKNGRDSIGKRLGMKKYGNEIVYPGNIIIKQRGNIFHPGINVKCGKDYTLYSIIKGKINFSKKGKKKKKIINVLPI